MNNCPNCGKGILTDQAICGCGELLRAEVTHHAHSWETETVLSGRNSVKTTHVATVSVALVVIATILALAWPQIRERWENSDDQINTDSNAAQSQLGSDLILPDDLIQTDSANGPVTQEGVFDFTNGGRGPQTAKSKGAFRTTEAGTEQKALTISGNSYDTQLLSDNTGSAAVPADAKSLSDCKPDITTALKRPESAPISNETKQQPKQTANYILGPRGGCFFVTVGGSKNYVDRSLCGAPTVAAARQD